MVNNRLFLLIVALFFFSLPESRSEKRGERYETLLPAVKEEGFYAIDLPWQVMGGAQADLSDIRIKDKRGKEVPYLIKEDQQYSAASEFVPYPTTVKARGRRTEILVETGNEPVSSLTFRIKNADVKKTANLQGSNDQTHWFAVKDWFELSHIYDKSQPNAELVIDFPLSDYKYYLLSVNDSTMAPLNILTTGKWKDAFYFKQNKWLVAPSDFRIEEKDDETEILLAYPYKYYFSKIVFYTSAPKYYKREVRFFRTVQTTVSPKRKLLRKYGYSEKVQQQDYLRSFLFSDGSGIATVNIDQYTDTLKLSIFNGDDRPLQIDSVRTYIDRFYLVAYLLPGETYVLTYGDEKAQPPVYDLSFEKYIPEKITHLSVGDVRIVPLQETEKPGVWLHFVKTYGTWIIIGGVILQILYMVRKLMKGESGRGNKE